MKRPLKLLCPLLLHLFVMPLHAQIGASPEEFSVRLGKPERETLKESGLIRFRKLGLCYIAHFENNRSDVLSIFSENQLMDLPEDLGEDRIASLLVSEGGNVTWNPSGRFSINRVWNSSDGKSFAVYDTMRHKLVIMTRAAYKREKSAVERTRSPPPLPRRSSGNAGGVSG